VNVRPATPELLQALGGDPLLLKADASYVAMEGDRPVAAAGIVELWKGRAYAWALFAPGPRNPLVHRHVRRFLDACGFPRVEMLVDPNDLRAQVWAEALGFQVECLMRKALPNGGNALMYARVK
jgi:hypothetical protein